MFAISLRLLQNFTITPDCLFKSLPSHFPLPFPRGYQYCLFSPQNSFVYSRNKMSFLLCNLTVLKPPQIKFLNSVFKPSRYFKYEYPDWYLYISALSLFVIAGPPITQSSLINNRDQPGTSAVPNLAPVGARLPPPLPQNLLYTVSERK